MSEKSSHNGVSRESYAAEFSCGPMLQLGYARVSTAKQDLERQIALRSCGVGRYAGDKERSKEPAEGLQSGERVGDPVLRGAPRRALSGADRGRQHDVQAVQQGP